MRNQTTKASVGPSGAPAHGRRARVGVDVGGTFTDVVVLDGGRVRTAKVPSTPADQSAGVAAGIEASGVASETVGTLAHGMTVATNALLERRGARCGLVTTEGFRDLIEIARQDRPSLYRLTQARPEPLVARELRWTVRERMGPGGELIPLDEGSVREVAEAVAEAGVEAVAVCLLFSFLHPAHEQRVGELLREALPGVHVSLSCEVLPEMREYERTQTTAADAYLAPRLATYLGELAGRVEAAGLPAPLVMQSSGGVVELDAAAAAAAACVLSGPAGGVVGAAHAAGASGYENVLSFDMGGTSTDVALVVGGEAQVTTESVVAGVPIRLPMVDVHTVSAGGGSVAWADAGGALRVGPRSAGAEPGPVAYGRGGEEPTVTDANLVLGHLADGTVLGDSVTLDRSAAEAALERLGSELGLSAIEAAAGVVAVADAAMAAALRVISVERGLDPRDFALVAFGGAGGLHACSLAEELSMSTVLVPRATGVLSALGLALSDLRRDYVTPLLGPLDGGEVPSGFDDAFARLESSAREDLEEPACERRADVRYRGQSFELTVGADDPGELAERFGVAHEQRYGYRMDDEPVELVALRLIATVAVDKPVAQEPEPDEPEDPPTRELRIGTEWVAAPIRQRSRLGRGSEVSGPSVVEFDEATLVVRPGWAGTVDATGTLVLERS